MKKILLFVLMLLSVFTLFACETTVDINKQLERIIPTEIKSDLVLDTNINGLDVSWYFNGELLTDGKLDQPYLDYARKLPLKAVIGNESYEFEVETESKYEIVSKLYLNTENQTGISKEAYVKGSVSLSNDGTYLNNDLSMKVKGRGNSTWGNPKKPYKIKFDDRVSLLGMKSAKTYVLLAEYNDKSLMRNYVAHKMASMLDVGYKIETRFVELYLNNNYEGFYTLTEQVETDKNKLSIAAGISPTDGFLIELEADDRVGNEGIEDIHWIRVNGRNYVIKSPDVDDFSNQELQIKAKSIKDYLIIVENSIAADTYDQYIDVDSFIDYFLIQELTKNVDSGYSSVYSFKDKNGLLTMGPIWDFDISLGNGDYFDSTYAGFHAYGANHWFTLLMDAPSFRARYILRYNEFYMNILDVIETSIIKVRESTIEERKLNFTRWQIMGEYVWPNPPHMVKADTVEKQDDLLLDYLNARADHLFVAYNK